MEILSWLQDLRNPLLNQIFSLITFLGSEEFFMLLIALITWCINRTLGVRLFFMLMVSQFINETLKGWVNEARPSAPIQPLDTDTAPGSSWPSGHSQNSATTWGMLATATYRWLFRIVALLLIFLVGLSRMYLGLHWPIDVLSGWLIGGLLVIAGFLLFRFFSSLDATKISPLWLVVLLVIPSLLLLVQPSELNVKVAGACTGAILGWWLERRYLHFEAPAPIRNQIIKAVIGIGVLFALRFALKALFGVIIPVTGLADFVRYFIMVLWVIWLAPALFIQMFKGATSAPVSVASR